MVVVAKLGRDTVSSLNQSMWLLHGLHWLNGSLSLAVYQVKPQQPGSELQVCCVSQCHALLFPVCPHHLQFEESDKILKECEK